MSKAIGDRYRKDIGTYCHAYVYINFGRILPKLTQSYIISQGQRHVYAYTLKLCLDHFRLFCLSLHLFSVPSIPVDILTELLLFADAGSRTWGSSGDTSEAAHWAI